MRKYTNSECKLICIQKYIYRFFLFHYGKGKKILCEIRRDGNELGIIRGMCDFNPQKGIFFWISIGFALVLLWYDVTRYVTLIETEKTHGNVHLCTSTHICRDKKICIWVKV